MYIVMICIKIINIYSIHVHKTHLPPENPNHFLCVSHLSQEAGLGTVASAGYPQISAESAGAGEVFRWHPGDGG